MSARSASAAILLAIAIAGCATPVPSQPTQFVGVANGRSVRLEQEASLRLPTGYSRRLAANRCWQLVGTVPAGDVYRPIDTVFTIEGEQVHEAYLVLARSSLVGFYLPAEHRYSSLSAPVTLVLGEVQ